MIYSSDDISDDAGIFNGWGREADPSRWEVTLPNLDTRRFFTMTGYDAFLQTPIGAAGEGAVNIIEFSGRSDVFRGLRNVMVNVSVTMGYFQTVRPAIKKVFSPLIQDLANNLKDAVDIFKIGVNIVGWIPIVGWVVQLIVAIARAIIGIVKSVRDSQERKNQAALNALARQVAIPTAFPDTGTDTIFGRMLQKKIMEYDVEWMMLPMFGATSPNDFQASAQRVGEKSDLSPCIDGYLITTRKLLGLGFMPGSMNLHGGMELSTRGGGIVRDVGDYFPVTQGIATSLWSQVLQGSGGMTFAVDTERVTSAWVDYVQAAMEFADDKLQRGWSLIAGQLNDPNIVDSTQYRCSDPCTWGVVGCSKGKDNGKWRGIPGRGHYSAYVTYFDEVFDWRRIDPGKGHGLNNINWDSIAPARALDNLHQRQAAMISSLKCMYLDDGNTEFGTPRYRALRRGSSLHRLWQRNVRAVFESGEWQNVDLRDVIPGSAIYAQIRDYTIDMNVPVERFFNMSKPPDKGQGRRTGAVDETVLGDPTPPTPPDAVDMQSEGLLGLGGGSGGSSGGAALAMGAVAVAAALLLRR